uniref:Uncharacterized protein n=1 Tax=Physcomitrium patens TaxID=3218 RepID=A0A2K1IYS8_PHYPA|nr:hypothetical protein PHYPA_024250 [Physcomitrium patens]
MILSSHHLYKNTNLPATSHRSNTKLGWTAERELLYLQDQALVTQNRGLLITYSDSPECKRIGMNLHSKTVPFCANPDRASSQPIYLAYFTSNEAYDPFHAHTLLLIIIQMSASQY